MAPLEAMACARARRGLGGSAVCSETVVDGETGYLVSDVCTFRAARAVAAARSGSARVFRHARRGGALKRSVGSGRRPG